MSPTARAIVYAVIIVHVLIVLFPFVWMLYSSLKTNAEFMASVWALPAVPQFQNYIAAWGNGDLGMYAANSLLVTGSSVIIIVLVATFAGYALAGFRTPWNRWVELLLVLCMAIPAYIALVPLAQILSQTGMLNSYVGLILPTVAFNVPISVFIMRSFFAAVPTALFDAARVDGANEWRVFARVAVPLAKPAMFTTAIINVIWVWNDFLFPLVFITDRKKQTLAVGITDFVGEHVVNYPILLAAIVLASLTTFVIYAIFQKQVVGGLMGGAVKQ